jgi:hypothetical protein
MNDILERRLEFLKLEAKGLYPLRNSESAERKIPNFRETSTMTQKPATAGNRS